MSDRLKMCFVNSPTVSVSVIIPAYNGMNYLPKTLESLLSQTFKDFEVIIVNDGSTDGIEDWFSTITDSRIKLISQVNQGIAAARNTGIAHAQGEYIAFLDTDDLWHSTKLEKQVQALDRNSEVGLVYTWVALINDRGKHLGKVRRHTVEGNVWQKLIERDLVASGSCPMIRRRCFETEGLFDRNIPSSVEDWDMWLRIAAHYRFKVIEETLVYYRRHEGNLSKNWHTALESYQMAIDKAFAAAPSELQYLKPRSYAFAYLDIAWKPLQSIKGDYQQARYFQQQAIIHHPQIIYSREYLRLGIAICFMSWLGRDRYNRFLTWSYAIRRRLGSYRLTI